MSSEKLGYDAPKHTRDEATELFVYHVRQATALFQLVPDDNNKSVIAEITRQCRSELPDVDLYPALKFASLLWEAYDAMKKND